MNWRPAHEWPGLLRDKRDDEELSFWNGVEGEEPTNVQFLSSPDGTKDLSTHRPSRWSQPVKYVRLVSIRGGGGCLKPMPGVADGAR